MLKGILPVRTYAGGIFLVIGPSPQNQFPPGLLRLSQCIEMIVQNLVLKKLMFDPNVEASRAVVMLLTFDSHIPVALGHDLIFSHPQWDLLLSCSHLQSSAAMEEETQLRGA